MGGEITIQPSALPWLVTILPVAFGALICLVGRFSRWLREPLAFVCIIATSACSIQVAGHALAGRTLTGWGQLLRVDGLSALVQLIGCLMVGLVLVYSVRYIPRQMPEDLRTPGKLGLYYGLVLVFLGMLNLTCTTNHMVLLYLSVEATTLVTALLIIYYWRREALEAAYKYLVLVGAGVTFALLGCVFLYTAGLNVLSGAEAMLLSSLSVVAAQLPTGVALVAAAFFVAGFGTKAGLMPFHAWLPDAHSEAPTPISALLSAVVIKVGAYALTRTLTVFAPYFSAIAVFVAILASVGMLLGVLLAWAQDDLKRLLAYHSVSQMGYIVEGLGLGTYLGVYGGLFHLLNHTLFKALLFMAVGAIMYATGGVRRISRLGRLAKKMPVTATCFFIGALAMGGLPLLNGFMSKLTLFVAVAEQQLMWAAVVGMLTSVLTLACLAHAAYRVFWGAADEPQAEVEQANEAPWPLLAAMIVLAGLCILIGVYPEAVHPLLDAATRSVVQALGGATH
jgi:formate hydrogenlyase subunit 3/multisubunit Na+/H+ antiporter MnhD subunit